MINEIIVGFSMIPGWVWAIIGMIVLPPVAFILIKWNRSRKAKREKKYGDNKKNKRC